MYVSTYVYIYKRISVKSACRQNFALGDSVKGQSTSFSLLLCNLRGRAKSAITYWPVLLATFHICKYTIFINFFSWILQSLIDGCMEKIQREKVNP